MKNWSSSDSTPVSVCIPAACIQIYNGVAQSKELEFLGEMADLEWSQTHKMSLVIIGVLDMV